VGEQGGRKTALESSEAVEVPLCRRPGFEHPVAESGRILIRAVLPEPTLPWLTISFRANGDFGVSRKKYGADGTLGLRKRGARGPNRLDRERNNSSAGRVPACLGLGHRCTFCEFKNFIPVVDLRAFGQRRTRTLTAAIAPSIG
jgi:hypothetical protein